MSIKYADTSLEILYVGVQARKVPLPGENKASGNVFNITMDQNEIFGAPKITLVVGKTYKFIINTPNHPFYITTDNEGAGVKRTPPISLIGAIDIPVEGPESKGNVGIEKGILIWTPKKEHTQMKLYYECNYHKFMGNEINVVMPPNIG